MDVRRRTFFAIIFYLAAFSPVAIWKSRSKGDREAREDASNRQFIGMKPLLAGRPIGCALENGGNFLSKCMTRQCHHYRRILALHATGSRGTNRAALRRWKAISATPGRRLNHPKAGGTAKVISPRSRSLRGGKAAKAGAHLRGASRRYPSLDFGKFDQPPGGRTFLRTESVVEP